MKHWKRVDIKNYNKHSSEFLNHYVNNTKQFKSFNTFWTQFKPEYYDDFFKEKVEFKAEISKLGTIREIALLTLNNKNTSLHTDHTSGLNNGVEYRLNIPIKNCEGSYTCFYDIPKENLNDHITTDGGTKQWVIEFEKLKPITIVELISPTILHTSYPHAVIGITNKLPRIAMTISFNEDISRFLYD